MSGCIGKGCAALLEGREEGSGNTARVARSDTSRREDSGRCGREPLCVGFTFAGANSAGGRAQRGIPQSWTDGSAGRLSGATDGGREVVHGAAGAEGGSAGKGVERRSAEAE